MFDSNRLVTLHNLQNGESAITTLKMNPKWPSNGSFAANLSLLVGGCLLGAGVSWSFRPGGLFGEPFDAVGAVLEARPSASGNALARRTDDPRTLAKTGYTPEAGNESVFALSGSFRDEGASAAKVNIAAALETGSGIASTADQLDYLRGVYSIWAETDPQAALDHAKANFPAGLIQSELIGLALSEWSQSNPREAWLWADANLEGSLRQRGLNDLLMGWTRRSPADAAAWLASTELASPSLFNVLSRTWAESDPLAALAWVSGLPEGKAKHQGLIAVADAYAADDPKAAVSEFQSLLEKEDNPDLVVALTNRWAKLDPAAAAEWVKSLPDGVSRREASATLATVWAASDVRAALAWSATISDVSLRTRTNTYIATTWGAIEPEKALNWLANQPPAEAAEGINGAFHSWAATDPVGLEAYLPEAGNGEWGELARRSLADVRSQNDPAGALNLALGLTDVGTRDDSMAKYFRKWNQRESANAGDWLDMNYPQLPASTVERLNVIRNQGKAQPTSTGGGPAGF